MILNSKGLLGKQQAHSYLYATQGKTKEIIKA